MIGHALWFQHRERFTDLINKKPVFIFDFDGTLAPIVSQPDAAAISPSTRRLLLALTERFTCAVVSGRARDDVAGRVSDIPFHSVIGNHGAEWQPPLAEEKDAALAVARWRQALGSDPELRDAVIEDKRLSLTVHYRNVEYPERVGRAALGAMQKLDGARLIPGKFCLNAVPVGLPRKGAAVSQLLERLGKSVGLYVGDDETDEDAFALRGPDFVTVRIGQSETTRAEFFLRNENEIDDLLRLLLTCGHGLSLREGP